MGNSNAFTMYIMNGHLVLFHCYLICLIDFVNMDLFVDSEKCCHLQYVFGLFTLKVVVNGIVGDAPFLSVCLLMLSVSRRYEAAVQRQCHLCSGHHLSLLLHNHSNTSKNLKTGTQNVNTTKKGMF